MHSHRRGPDWPGDHIDHIMRRAIRRKFRDAFAGGPFGFGPGPGGHGTFRARRMLGDGELRLIALSLIAESPRHGYDIIRALEEKSRGAYSPSPGVVYPTLTFLEEAGYATSTAEANKKVYAITEAGRAHLAENEELVTAALAEIERFGRRMEGARQWFEEAELDIDVDGAGEGEEADPGDYRERPGRTRMAGAFRDLHRARRDLQMAMRELFRAGPSAVVRGADILRKAAEDLQAAADEGRSKK
jgi:DNA-binding PadR family transcriptional regulator